MHQLEDKLQSEAFDESDFIGDGWYIACLRWYRQFLALIDKNIRIYLRRKVYLLLSLFLPVIAILIFFAGNGTLSHHHSNDQTTKQIPTELKGLGRCDSFFNDDGKCLQIAFAPKTVWTEQVMKNVASYNSLNYNNNNNVRGFDSINDLKTYVASNLGTVQFSVFFYENDQPLWYSTTDPYCSDPLTTHCPTNIPKNINDTISYMIYYNSTYGSTDSRSSYHKVNFPLLVLQKSIEEFILKSNTDYSNVVYDASFAQTWSYNPATPYTTTTPYTATATSTNSTTCGDVDHDVFNVNLASPLVFTYVFQFIGILCFQVITEERHKGLLRSLRTLGLNHSTYWITWLLLFQGLAILGSIFALILASIVRPYVYVLQHLDFGVLFLFLWMAMSCSIGNAMFLSSFIPTGNWSSVVIFLNFFGAFLTLIFMIFTTDTYTYISFPSATDDGNGDNVIWSCLWSPSAYSAVYDKRTGGGVLQFVVFWLPWYHIGKVLTEIFSIIQYGGDYHLHMMYESRTMYYYEGISMVPTSFDPPTVSWTLGIMFLLTIVYVLLAWLCEQLVEGIPIDVILIPSWYRIYILGLHSNPIFATDYRGIERQRSEQEESIRAYKISKTYDKVQALKEVSFNIQKGEVFCLLGHNGAGKSTLFNILSGITSTTHGNVYILGHDCNFEMMAIQQMIGICPQSDYLWDELTALEHMHIYARFKGLRVGPKLDAACLNVLSIVGLADRSHTLAKNFSGGMKRRLSAAMSVIGQVKVLYLDEPTTGLDPLSRRAIWDMVSIMKKDRVVVLTTHNLEEADYLADRIMILQNGQVKALGTSLALKQTYGTGYQVRMIVDPRLAQPVSSEVSKFLPRSTFGGDISTGNIIIRVAQIDYLFFGRFLQWLELVEQRYSSMNEVIKEWGISNTTLEQVFLILCESAQTNYSGGNDRAENNIENICPLCESNPKEAIALIKVSEDSQLMLPHAICRQCEALPFFIIKNEVLSPLLQQQLIENADQRRLFISQLFTNAQNRRYQQLNQQQSAAHSLDEDFRRAILNSGGGDGGTVETVPSPALLSEELVGAAQMIQQQQQQQPMIIPQAIQAPVQYATPTNNTNANNQSRIGKLKDVVNALSIKNLQLQSYQRCSTCCVLFTMILLVVSVVIIGLIWTSASTCPQGNTVNTFNDESCDISYQSNYLFTAQESIGWFNGHVFPSTFNVSALVYLIPRFTGYYNSLYEDASMTTTPTNAMPMFPNRIGTIWAANVNGTLSEYLKGESMFYPKGLSIDSSTWNQELYQFQQENYAAVMDDDVDNPNHCLYSVDNFINTTSLAARRIAFAKRYADAIFDCSSCVMNTSYFKGNLWVSSVSTKDYPYAFINSPAEYYYASGSCPEVATQTPFTYYYNLNVEYAYYSTFYIVNNTVQAMQFINTLTNSLYDPTGQDMMIQAGVSSYTTVSYDHGASQFLVFLLTMLIVLLMNGVFPMAVWRLSYERIAKLRLMMNSIGLKDPLYAFGMYIFDFVVMLAINIIASLVLVLGKFSYFKNVPLGYMIALSLLSAYSLCGLAFVFVRFTPTTSRVTTLIATLLTYVGSIAASLICIIKYRDEGTWPNGLSIIPYFAQVRVLWVLLSVGKGTEEVSYGLGLLFVFGTCCLLIEYVSASSDLLMHSIMRLLSSTGSSPSPSPPNEGRAVVDEENKLLSNEDDNDMNDIDEDDDVRHEKALINSLSPQQYDDYAIVIKNLRREFILDDHRKAPLVAVDNINLGLRFGEVFGLLGPNGAGKSTTLSILCGILQPTSGEVYIAGQNIHDINAVAFHSFIGICPQADICWEDLSVEQHLGFQARLRGVPYTHVSAEVQRVAVKVGLDGDAYRTSAGKLSGGQRRRLSIGMSIVADPPIIFLDEPSAGLDPNTRKGLWQLITSLKEPHRCIVLTTHSMEEAETLCTRLGVISEGKLRCLGTGLHLKRKFGTGYTIELSVAANTTTTSALVPHYHPPTTLEQGASVSNPAAANATAAAAAAAAASTSGPSAIDIDEFMYKEIGLQHAASPANMLLSAINLTRKYMIPKHPSIKISDIFVKMEAQKKVLGISQWSISETTLEDIFISLVLQSRGVKISSSRLHPDNRTGGGTVAGNVLPSSLKAMVVSGVIDDSNKDNGQDKDQDNEYAKLEQHDHDGEADQQR